MIELRENIGCHNRKIEGIEYENFSLIGMLLFVVVFQYRFLPDQASTFDKRWNGAAKR